MCRRTLSVEDRIREFTAGLRGDSLETLNEEHRKHGQLPATKSGYATVCRTAKKFLDGTTDRTFHDIINHGAQFSD